MRNITTNFILSIFLSLCFVVGCVGVAKIENPYMNEIIELNKECTRLDKLLLEKKVFRLAKRQLTQSLPHSDDHISFVLEDQEGKSWLFKISLSSKTEELVYIYYRQAGIKIPMNYSITLFINGRKTQGSIQQFLANSENADKIPFTALTSKNIAYIQQQQVMDWLFSNFDCQFLINTVNGELIGIDKDESFWGIALKEGQLNRNYYPYEDGADDFYYYNRFWRAYIEGKMNLSLETSFELIYFLQDIDDKVIVGMCQELMSDDMLISHLHYDRYVRDQIEAECIKRAKELDYIGMDPSERDCLLALKEQLDSVASSVEKESGAESDANFVNSLDQNSLLALIEKIDGFKSRVIKKGFDQTTFLDLVLERKHSLSKSFIQFYSSLAQERHEKFIPPPRDKEFRYSRMVLNELKKMIADKKAKLMHSAQYPKNLQHDIEIITSVMGRYYLKECLKGRRSVKETIEKLKYLRKNYSSPHEKLALSLYIAALEKNKEKIDEVFVLNPISLETSQLIDFYVERGKKNREPEFFYALGLYYMIKGMPQKAIQYLKRAKDAGFNDDNIEVPFGGQGA